MVVTIQDTMTILHVIMIIIQEIVLIRKLNVAIQDQDLDHHVKVDFVI